MVSFVGLDWLQSTKSIRTLFVGFADFFAMTDFNHQSDESVVNDVYQKAIVADAISPNTLFVAYQGFAKLTRLIGLIQILRNPGQNQTGDLWIKLPE